MRLIQNDDFTLFSGHHKTRIKEEDLPEWYVFGRYYKLWGFLSTKGITDLRYIRGTAKHLAIGGAPHE